MPIIRTATVLDSPRLWALNNLPNVGHTADDSTPIDLPLAPEPPASFPDLANVELSFGSVGGDFVVAVDDADRLLGMGGFKPTSPSAARVLRVRVHPAVRRRGVGRLLMEELERRAGSRGLCEIELDTATNQPDAVAFYESLGYDVVQYESKPEWSWTLVHFRKHL